VLRIKDIEGGIVDFERSGGEGGLDLAAEGGKVAEAAVEG
jgi:hypothetical protein